MGIIENLSPLAIIALAFFIFTMLGSIFFWCAGLYLLPQNSLPQLSKVMLSNLLTIYTILSMISLAILVSEYFPEKLSGWIGKVIASILVIGWYSILVLIYTFTYNHRFGSNITFEEMCKYLLTFKEVLYPFILAICLPFFWSYLKEKIER